jgi:tetratricopeptide (TPR) repeat protein
MRSGLILIVAAVCASCAVRERPITGVTAGTSVLVADVRNETGDTSFDRGLLDAARVALRQSGHVRDHPRTRVAETYRLMKIADPRTSLSYELAQEVAEREGARFVLGLSVARLGSDYVLGARLADVQRQASVAELRETFSSPDRVVEALDKLMARTRRVLGEAERSLSTRRASLPRVVTSSLGALRSFSEGNAAWVQSRYPEARDQWHRAIELDTGFAMAYGALGGYYYYHRDRERGERYYGEALARSSRLTEWERLRLGMNLQGFRGQLDSSTVLAGVIAQRFPSVEAWYDYGTGLMQLARDREAILALNQALEIDSTFTNAWINLATVYVAMGRFADAVAAYQGADRTDSMALYSNFINHEYGSALIANGQTAEAQRVFRRMSASPALGNRQFGFRSLGYLALWEGRLDDAVGDYQQAIEITRQQGGGLSEGRNRLLLAAVHRSLNRIDAANAELSRVLEMTPQPTFDPTFMGPVAFELKQLERWRDLDSLIALIRARAVPTERLHQDALNLALSVAHLGRRQPDSALAALRTVTQYRWRVFPLAVRAEAYSMLRQRDSALAVLDLLEREQAFGREGQVEWMRAPLLRGELLSQSGDTTGAIRAYEEMIARWRGANVPDVAAARSRLAALRAGR